MEEMELAELFAQKCEENQTRKVLEILEHSNDLDEAIDKVRALIQ